MAKTADQRKIVSPVNVEKRQEINIQTGDTVRVMEKFPEGDDYRLQPFEGIVLSQKHGHEPGATFTVRQEVEGVGVEKIFPLYTPQIDEISIIRRARTRRSKLYHIRDKAARQIRREMRRMVNVDISTGSDAEKKEEAEAESESSEDDEGTSKTDGDDGEQETGQENEADENGQMQEEAVVSDSEEEASEDQQEEKKEGDEQ